MKGLMILLGESFRSGLQNSRVSGEPDSYDIQKKTCDSHIDFLQNLPYKCDIIISTYNTPYNEQLLDWYKEYLHDYKIHNDAIGLHNNYMYIISRWKHIFHNYDYIFFLRIDLCLKPMFKTVWQTPVDKIMYPFICFIPYHKTYKGLPRIADTMIYIPKSKYNILFYSNTIPEVFSHDSWYYLLQSGIQSSHIDVFLKTYHDSDSYKDWNPLYCMLYRPQRLTWQTKGYVFDPKILDATSSDDTYDIMQYE
jgi:hypothetical protein